MLDEEEVGVAVDAALTVRNQAASNGERDVLVRSTLGVLRLMDDPSGGPLGDLLTRLGAPSGPRQAAQVIVDAWRQGRLDSPPFPQRPQMGPLLSSAFEKLGREVPAPAAIGVLVDVCIGMLDDQERMAPPAAAKLGVTQAIARVYVVGG